MDDAESLQRAMTMAEIAVQDMADAGLTPMHIAIGLAFHMQRQAEIAIPYPVQCKMWLASLAGVA